MEQIKPFIRDGIDINYADKIGWTGTYLTDCRTTAAYFLMKLIWTALHHAAFVGNAKVAKYLLERGANVNQRNNEGYTPLHW